MHWKTLFNYEHLGCQDLPRSEDGKKTLDIVVSIIKLDKREVVTEGGRKEELPVADLKGAPKPMIMNKTNLKTLSMLFNSSDYEDFVDKPFTIYAAKVKGKAGGLVDGLRIRDKAPSLSKPELTPNHKRWVGAISALSAGNTTVDAIKQNFSLSKENEDLLNCYKNG